MAATNRGFPVKYSVEYLGGILEVPWVIIGEYSVNAWGNTQGIIEGIFGNYSGNIEGISKGIIEGIIVGLLRE